MFLVSWLGWLGSVKRQNSEKILLFQISKERINANFICTRSGMHFLFSKFFPWLHPCWGLGLPLNYGKFILQSPYPYYHSPWKIRKPCMIYIFCNLVYKRKRCKVIKLQVNSFIRNCIKKASVVVVLVYKHHAKCYFIAYVINL